MFMMFMTEGAEDPWEKLEWGRKLQHYPTVEEFVAFPGMLAKPAQCLHACMHSSYTFLQVGIQAPVHSLQSRILVSTKLCYTSCKGAVAQATAVVSVAGPCRCRSLPNG